MGTIHSHSLGKHEILRKQQLISLLFSSGKSAKGNFLRVVYAFVDPEHAVVRGATAFMPVVGKKKLSSAVQRNRIKRMMREAYRLEKAGFARHREYPQNESALKMLCLVFIYMGGKKPFPALELFRQEMRELAEKITCS